MFYPCSVVRQHHDAILETVLTRGDQLYYGPGKVKSVCICVYVCLVLNTSYSLDRTQSQDHIT